MIGKKFTKTFVYEFEVIDIERPIPKEEELNFIEWLLSLSATCPVGKNHEYFCYSEDYKDDIGVTFYIRIK